MQKWHLKILVPSRASVLILGYICELPKDLLKLQYHILLLREPQHLWGEAGHQRQWTWAKPRSGIQQGWSCVQTCSGYSPYIIAHTTMRHLLSSDGITNKFLILINWSLKQKSNSTEVHQPRQSLIIFFPLVRKLCPTNCLLPMATSQGTDGTVHVILPTLCTADHSLPHYVFTTCVQQPNNHITCMKRTRDILNGNLPVFQIL